jgi:hypothetical protein
LIPLTGPMKREMQTKASEACRPILEWAKRRRGDLRSEARRVALRTRRTYPEGMIGLSLGFQPQEHPRKAPALKGPEEISLIDGSLDQRPLLKQSCCRPFRAVSLILSVPGVKTPGWEIDVPLLTLFALNELHFSWETHPRILTSYITRYKPENASPSSS